VLAERIRAVVPTLAINEPLKDHTTYHIGGPAAYFAAVSDREQLCLLKKLSIAERIPLMVIGGGSNTLFLDEGFAGIVLKLAGSLAQIAWREDGTVAAGERRLLAW
jgi:UDP-N-acetylmuramate dehydrogenase